MAIFPMCTNGIKAEIEYKNKAKKYNIETRQDQATMRNQILEAVIDNISKTYFKFIPKPIKTQRFQ